MKWFGLLFLALLAGCATVSTPATAVTPTILSANTRPPTAVPATLTPSATPPPTITPSPAPSTTPAPYLTPLPTVTPSATPTLYPNVWLSGILRSNTELLLGGSSVPLPFTLISVQLDAADETAQTALEAASTDTLLKLTGDLYPQDEYSARFVYRDVAYVYPLYTPETPLDATFIHPQGLYQFNYPAGWQIEVGDKGSVSLNNHPPDLISLADLGIEFIDERAYFLRITVVEDESAADYIARRVQEQDPEFGQAEVTAVTIDDQAAIRLVTQSFLGSWVEYVLELEDLTLSIGIFAEKSSFAERIITTLR